MQNTASGFVVVVLSVLSLICTSSASAQVIGAGPHVRLSLRSSVSVPHVVAPGSTVQWEVVAEVSNDNFGLAGFLCSVIECDSYDYIVGPIQVAALWMQPSEIVPTGMSNFAAPDGVCNPPNPHVPIPGNGYGGEQFYFSNGLDDAVGLLELGGMQNTTGVPLPLSSPMGRSSTLTLGVGQQPGGEVVAQGSFRVPPRGTAPPDPDFDFPWILQLCIPFEQMNDAQVLDAVGVFGARNFAQANVILAVGTPGQPSHVAAAEVILGPRLEFEVRCLADFNESGTLEPADIFAFLSAWFSWTSGTTGGRSPDINQDGVVNVQDIFFFLTLWFAGCG